MGERNSVAEWPRPLQVAENSNCLVAMHLMMLQMIQDILPWAWHSTAAFDGLHYNCPGIFN